MRKKVLLFFICCMICVSVFSQNNEESNSDIQTTEVEKANNEFAVLNTKLEACKDSFDRVNTTYQWAIGILVAVVLSLFGIIGYNHQKNYSSDLQKIKDDLEQDFKNKIDELLQKNSKSISDKTNFIEHRLKQELLQQRYEFLTYKFEHETSKRLKLSLSLKILNTLSDANWGYSDSLFNDCFDFIKECCSKEIFFDHSEVDDVNEMLSKLPERFYSEKEKLQAIIQYEK